MKANELMIGDWVRCTDPKPFRIEQMDGVEEQVYGDDGFFVDTGDLQPIPLTAEILEKNGFEEDDCYSRYTLYFDNRRVRSSSIEVVPQDEDWSEIEMSIRSGRADISSIVEYVHELQHALRLCGVEKEIEL